MGRWEPDAQGRLQQAAMALFRERGYAEVTVAEIADRAGLTKRTFFNHFADKREVLFAGAKALEASIVKHLTEAGDDLDPLDYSDFPRPRGELIASSPERKDRDLIKMPPLASPIAEPRRQRHAP